MKESWPCITCRWWMLFWWTQGWKFNQVTLGTYRTRYATENTSCLPPTWSFICRVRQSQRCLPENHITPVITWGSKSKNCVCQIFTSFCSFNILDSLVKSLLFNVPSSSSVFTYFIHLLVLSPLYGTADTSSTSVLQFPTYFQSHSERAER